jgi:hypothetical protein
MATLRKPETKLHRRFLYLDGDDVINMLSALEGGDVDEILTRTGEDASSGKGGEIDLKVAKGKGSKNKTRRFEEEMKRKRTTHSATTALLRKLHEANAVGVLDGDYDAEIYAELEPHMLLEFKANIRIHPLHQAISAIRALVKSGPALGVAKSDIADARGVLKLVEQLSQTGDASKTFLAFATTTGTTDGYLLLLPIQEANLLVPLDDFGGEATFVAHVDRIFAPDEEMMALRILRNSPLLPMEQEGLRDAIPGLVTVLNNLGIDAEEEEFILGKPAVLLKPVCIFK